MVQTVRFRVVRTFFGGQQGQYSILNQSGGPQRLLITAPNLSDGGIGSSCQIGSSSYHIFAVLHRVPPLVVSGAGGSLTMFFSTDAGNRNPEKFCNVIR
jgi:hypothetical protein